MAFTTERTIELDERRRTSLAKVGRKEHNKYAVTEQADGTLVLTPVVLVSAQDAALLSDADLLAELERRRNATKPEPKPKGIVAANRASLRNNADA